MSALRREVIATVLLEQFERHQYAVGYEGVVSDGEVAWLACTCGWSENFEMPEDNIRLAERQWEAHQASAFAAALDAALDAAPAQEGKHFPSQTDQGPDFCKACSDAAREWVTWPCPAARGGVK